MESIGRVTDAGPVGMRRPSTRILFLNENLGGHATVHVGISEALAAHADVEGEFVDVPSPGLLRRLLAAPVPGLARLDLDLQPLRYQLAASLVARRVLRERAGRFDALHVYTQNAALASPEMLRHMPTVVSTDSTNVRNAFVLPYRYPTRFTSKTLPASMWFERRVFDAATLVVATSRWIRASLVHDYAVPEEKIRVVPFGITVPHAVARTERSGPSRITFVGNTLERKGGLRLLELHQHHLRDRCTLTLVTHERVPPGLPGVEVRNDVVPGDGKLASILASTDVFVFPSSMDQSPNAVLEAMAFGLPVVALPVAALPEMVEDRVTGLLVSEHDDAALLAAVSKLVEEPALARAMGAKARERVLERFDARVATGRLLEVIGDAIALRTGARGERL